MKYTIRLKLAYLFFKLGRWAHPDIALLNGKIQQAKDSIACFDIMVDSKGEDK